jgi:hypothetical protein
MLYRCCLVALARFGWLNLDLNDIFLERQSLPQETTSSTLKVKTREKVLWIELIFFYILCFIYFLDLCLLGAMSKYSFP